MLINLNYLKSANVAASIEQTRYYLMGVQLTVVGSNVLYVATNGAALIALRQDLDASSECIWPASGVIIPSSLIAQIKQTPTSKRCGDVAEITFINGIISIAVMGGATYSDKAIDGSFPEWRRVVPSTVNGETAQFDPALLASFAKARKAICGGSSKFITVGHNGGGPALVSFCDDANDGFGVIMPVRGDAPTAAPSWISFAPAPMAQAAE
jgi:DNA polymerase-3 subunit beta